MADCFAELHPAYFWTCDECGRDSFTRSIVVQPSYLLENLPDHDNREAFADWIEAGGGVSLTMAPDRVTCSHCQATFAVAHDASEEEDDDPL